MAFMSVLFVSVILPPPIDLLGYNYYLSLLIPVILKLKRAFLSRAAGRRNPLSVQAGRL
jgi:hypothetical protein